MVRVISTPIKTRYYVYNKPISVGYKSDRKNYDKNPDGEKSNFSLFRARDNIMDTINSNITPFSKFITLTCRQACLDRSRFLGLVKNFQRLFFKKFGYHLPYVGIIERQKKRGQKEGNAGSWHIHLVVFLEEFLDLPKLCSCWLAGHIDLEIVRSGDLGRYFMKYLSKDNPDIKKNEKVLFKSHHLKGPSIFESHDVLAIPQFDYTKSWTFYQGDFESDLELGQIDENKFNSCTLYEVHHVQRGGNEHERVGTS